MEGRNRKLNRWPGYDYSQSGLYFITIVTQNRVEWFGRVANGEMILNQYGKIVQTQWNWLGQQYPYIALDIFQIMPNHFHAIIGINVGMRYIPVGTGRDLSLQTAQPQSSKIKSLSELIGAFKTTSSKSIHAQGNYEFLWQRSFHDRVIRNDEELHRIRQYIYYNPVNWPTDRNNI